MKYNFRISTLSIICAISAGVSVPVFGAPAVRSLGGAGTYAGTAGAVGGVLSAAPSAGRAGSVSSGRVGSATATNSTMSGVSSNRVASTRAVASPRLSIGKYLSGATIGGATGGGTTGGSTIKPGQSGVDTDGLKDRIDDLEVKVDDLANDIADLTGQTTTVEYEDGILTIIQDNRTIAEYDLSEYLATQDELLELEEQLNDLVIPTKVSELENDAGYITQADIPSTDGFATQDELTELTKQLEVLRELISGLDYVESGDLTNINNLIIELKNGQTLNQSQIQVLQQTLNELNQTYATDEELAQAIENVNAGLAGLENYYTKTESDARFQQVLNDEVNVIQDGETGVVKSVSAADGIVTVERELIKDADVADDAKISANKIDGLDEFAEEVYQNVENVYQEVENVTQDLDDVKNAFKDLQLDNVLHGIMADGTYVINFSQDGTVSYSRVEFIGADNKPIDMSSQGAVWPDDGKPK